MDGFSRILEKKGGGLLCTPLYFRKEITKNGNNGIKKQLRPRSKNKTEIRLVDKIKGEAHSRIS